MTKQTRNPNDEGPSARGRSVALALLAAALLACAGCPQPPVCPVEFVPAWRLIALHNVNAAQVDDLRARAVIAVTLIDEKGRRQNPPRVQGDVYLHKRSDDPFGPQDLVIRARELGQELFRLGSDATAGIFYVRYDIGDNHGGWWGQFADLRGGDSSGMDPTQLLSVLGVLPWNPDPSGYVATSYADARMMLPGRGESASIWYKPPEHADPCVYVLMFLAPKPGGSGLYVQREVWLDRYKDSHLPMRVRLNDSRDRTVMDARLFDYKEIDLGEGERPWPIMPTRIEIDWPLAASGAGGEGPRLASMRLELTGMARPVPPPLPEAYKVPDGVLSLPQVPAAADEPASAPSSAPASAQASTKGGR